MKLSNITLLHLATVATAAVVDTHDDFSGLRTQDNEDHDTHWWSGPRHGASAVASGIEDLLASAEEEMLDGLDAMLLAEQELQEDDFDVDSIFDEHPPHHGRPPRHGHPHRPDLSNLTIYQIICESNHTTKFAKFVNKYDSIVDILNSTDANLTLFVPVDHPKKDHDHDGHHDESDHKKPSKGEIEDALKYFIADGLYPARRLLATHTVPTLLKEKFLGGEKQRLAISFGLLSGLRVNFYSKIIFPNVIAKNGIIHAMNNPVFPPPMVGRELTLFPQLFSTLLLAYDKTDFVSFIHGVKMNGSTVFAPTNKAFARLGPRANAFLFNTERGLHYLKALLKYHIVANATLYSDAFYSADGSATGLGDEEAQTTGPRYHVDLPTLLDGKHVSVDISRWARFISMKVNGYVPVVIQDGVAKNGVIQVVGGVLFPPRRPGHEAEEFRGEIDVEDLKQRLDGYLEDDERQGITDL